MPVADDIDWKDFIKGKWLLWDSCALIKVIKYQAEDIFDTLAALKTLNLYIPPVQLELFATNDKQDSIKRAAALSTYFDLIAFTNVEIEKARKIQAVIGAICQPSPVDLFLAGTIARYNSSPYLVTENTRDFPSPYFKKECFITLHDDKSTCALTILSIDKSKLSI